MNIFYKQTLLFFTLIFINQVSAVDGIIELNQTCAVQTGCFSGDNAGFPIIITTSVTGLSFRLTSDLILADENTTGIIIGIGNVTIDFNGFSLIRQSRYKHLCSPVTGTGNGIIYTSNIFAEGTTIKNGSIIGVGANGIHLPGRNIIIENMLIGNSGATGILLSVGGVGTSSTGSVIRKNTIFKNTDDGININGSAVVTRNTVDSNGGDGVNCVIWCDVNNNMITSNSGDGVYVVGVSSKGSLVQNNTISGNDLFGIRFGSGSARSAYKGNYITNNFSGTVSGTKGFDLGQNFCTSNDVCP